jgi:hypothetical protein
VYGGLHAAGSLTGGALELATLHVGQRGVLDADGTARALLGSAPRAAGSAGSAGSRLSVDAAQVRLNQLQFPAAYTTFLQLPLAVTEFGALQTTGRASVLLQIGQGPVRLGVALDDLDIDDPASRLDVDDLRGAAFSLAHETRIAVLDGAIVVRSLSAAAVGGPDARLGLDASIERISLPRLRTAALRLVAGRIRRTPLHDPRRPLAPSDQAEGSHESRERRRRRRRGPAGRGSYHIVKGRGLPRLDIIGNAGRVNWTQLLSQTEAAMRGGALVVH